MKLLKSIAVGVAIGFTAAFVTELALQATGARDETRKKVNKAADVITTAAMVVTLVV